jgi:predicted Zn-dependent protease
VRKLDAFMERSGGLLRLATKVDLRVSSAQRQALLTTYACAALMAGAVDSAREAVRSLDKQMPGSVKLLQASIMARDGKIKEALTVLASAEGDEAALMRVQLAATAGDLKLALELLGGLPGHLLHRPAVVATRLALMERVGSRQEAVAALEKALQDLEGLGAASLQGGAVRWLVKRLASLLLQEGDLAGAAKQFKRLGSLDPTALEGDHGFRCSVAVFALN